MYIYILYIYIYILLYIYIIHIVYIYYIVYIYICVYALEYTIVTYTMFINICSDPPCIFAHGASTYSDSQVVPCAGESVRMDGTCPHIPLLLVNVLQTHANITIYPFLHTKQMGTPTEVTSNEIVESIMFNGEN